MAKVNFSKLKLKVDKGVTQVKLEGIDGEIFDIEVLRYLPLTEKTILISEAVKLSIVNGIIRNEILTAVFAVGVVKNYTNLMFTPTMLANEVDLYDVLESNGIIHTVLEAMDPNELEELNQYVDSYASQMKESLVSAISGYQAQSESMKEFLGLAVDKTSE